MSDEEALRALAQLDRVVHEPVRLSAMAHLSLVKRADFLFLMHELGVTQGNLSQHMSKLEEAGYLECSKSFEGRLPRTSFRLTAEGRGALGRYLDHMEALIQAVHHGGRDQRGPREGPQHLGRVTEHSGSYFRTTTANQTMIVARVA